jgi:hypothetical protein
MIIDISFGSSVNIETRLKAGRLCNWGWILCKNKRFFFFMYSREYPGPARPPVQKVPTLLSSGVELTNTWRYT